MSLFYSPSIIIDQLIMYLDSVNLKSYPGSGTNWFDLSNNKYTATLNGSLSISNGIANFDGINDSVSLPDFSEIRLADVSFGFVFKLNSTASDQDLLNKGFHDTGAPLLIWFDKTVDSGDSGVGNVNCISAYSFDGTTSHWISTNSNTILSGQYYYLAVVFKPSTGEASIYLNGQLAKTNTKTWGGVRNINSSISLGSAATSMLFINGEINNFHIYNKGLSLLEVKQNYDALRSRYGI